jgi:hypothetical protein
MNLKNYTREKTNFVKANLEGIDLPHEEADIGTSNGANNVVSSLLYDRLLDITIIH